MIMAHFYKFIYYMWKHGVTAEAVTLRDHAVLRNLISFYLYSPDRD
jgi:hypothetical protein